jgi:hypothetical protein
VVTTYRVSSKDAPSESGARASTSRLAVAGLEPAATAMANRAQANALPARVDPQTHGDGECEHVSIRAVASFESTAVTSAPTA